MRRRGGGGLQDADYTHQRWRLLSLAAARQTTEKHSSLRKGETTVVEMKV